MRPGGRRITLLGVIAFAAVACTNPERPSVQSQPVSLPTPLRSADASVEATVGLLEDSVAAIDERIAIEARPYRPSEPASLLQAPRAVLRVDLADPDDGFVVVYDFPDASAARDAGEAMADYLESGFGQTNFPVDSQFSVTLVGDTMIFTTWSRGRSDAPERAQAAFDAIASVGEQVEVLK